jgi:hypothetical protein
VWDLAGRQGPVEELPQLNPSPSIMRLSSTSRLLAASTDEGRAGVWRLAEGGWELLRDLIVATREADADGETILRKKTAKGPDGFVDIGMLEIPSIATDDAGTRIVWSTNGGAILTVLLNQPSQRTMVVVPPGHMPHEDLVVSGNGRVIAAIEAGGSRISVAELDASGGVLSALIGVPGATLEACVRVSSPEGNISTDEKLLG